METMTPARAVAIVLTSLVVVALLIRSNPLSAQSNCAEAEKLTEQIRRLTEAYDKALIGLIAFVEYVVLLQVVLAQSHQTASTDPDRTASPSPSSAAAHAHAWAEHGPPEAPIRHPPSGRKIHIELGANDVAELNRNQYTRTEPGYQIWYLLCVCPCCLNDALLRFVLHCTGHLSLFRR